jgi:hypothetical protein
VTIKLEPIRNVPIYRAYLPGGTTVSVIQDSGALWAVNVNSPTGNKLYRFFHRYDEALEVARAYTQRLTKKRAQ